MSIAATLAPSLGVHSCLPNHTRLKTEGLEQISGDCIPLRLPNGRIRRIVMLQATAITLFKRFFVLNSVMEHDPKSIMCAFAAQSASYFALSHKPPFFLGARLCTLHTRWTSAMVTHGSLSRSCARTCMRRSRKSLKMN